MEKLSTACRFRKVVDWVLRPTHAQSTGNHYGQSMSSRCTSQWLSRVLFSLFCMCVLFWLNKTNLSKAFLKQTSLPVLSYYYHDFILSHNVVALPWASEWFQIRLDWLPCLARSWNICDIDLVIVFLVTPIVSNCVSILLQGRLNMFRLSFSIFGDIRPWLNQISRLRRAWKPW